MSSFENDRQQMIEPKSGKPGAAQPANHKLDGLSSCMRLARRPFSLRFKSRAVEENYLLEVASGRFPVFIATASFDFVLVLIRVVVSAFNGSQEGNAPPVFKILCTGVMNLVVLYSFMGLIYRHSRRSGLAASRVSERPDCTVMHSRPSAAQIKHPTCGNILLMIIIFFSVAE